MFHLLVLISLLASNNVIAVTLNASLLNQLGYNNQSSSINIGDYSINDIDPNAFKGYSKLKDLSLSSNAFTKIDLGVFKDLVNL